MDDDSDRGSEASSGSRSKKGNSTKSGKSKSNRKKLDDGVDGDSDTSQASGKNNKKKTKNTPKMKREKVIISKKRKERKKSAGEISFIICSLTYDKCGICLLSDHFNQLVSLLQEMMMTM